MKRVLFIVLIAAGALALLLTLFMIFVHTPPVRQYVLELVTKHARLRYGVELSIDRFDYSLMKGSVALEGVKLRSAGAGELPPLFQARRIYADLDIGSFLNGPVAIERAELDGAVVRVMTLQNGPSNIPQLEGGDGGGFGLLIDSLEARDVQIDFEDRRQQIALRLSSIDICARGRRDDRAHDISMKTDQGGTLVYQGDELDIENLDIESRLFPSEIKIERVHLVAANSRVQGGGSIRNFSDPVIDMTLDADIDLGKVAGGQGLFPGVQGHATGTIAIKGPIKSLQIKGEVKGTVH